MLSKKETFGMVLQTENGSSQSQILALTFVFVPNQLDSGDLLLYCPHGLLVRDGIKLRILVYLVMYESG